MRGIEQFGATGTGRRRRRRARRALCGLLFVGLVWPAMAAATSHTPQRPSVFPVEPVDETLHGTIHHLGTLGGDFSRVTDVDGQVVVGNADLPDNGTDDTDSHAFAYDLGAPNPRMVDLGTLGGNVSEAVAVSDHVVVGTAETADESRHAFAYDLAAANPHMVDLGSLGGDGETRPSAVDDGVVVGSSTRPCADGAECVTEAFAYDLNAASPKIIGLGTLGGRSFAVDIDMGIVVGWSTTRLVGEPLRAHAFAYNLNAASPRMRDLGSGTEGGSAFVTATAGNLVVGTENNSLGDVSHAFVSDLGTPGAPIRNLGDLGGAEGVSQGEDVSAQVVVGSATRGGQSQWAFAEDMSAQNPVMRSLGSLGGHVGDSAEEVDGDIVAGHSDMVATHNDHAFAYDLGTATPRMSDLGPAFAGNENNIHVSGNVVGGTQLFGEGGRAVAWTLSRTNAPALRLTQTKTFVRENTGPTTITVVRDGDPTQPVTIGYSTMGIVARSGTDFTPTRGTLSFAAGQTSATFRIPILNDKRREGREKFLVRLSNPSGGAIRGTPRAAAVIILPSDR